MFYNFKISVFVIVLIFTGFCESLCGQGIWIDRSHRKTISLEILKPNFDGEDRTTFLTSAWYLSGRFAVSNIIVLVGEVPFAFFGVKSEFSNADNETAFGNPYLGIEIHPTNSNFFGQIGGRIPIAPDDDEDGGSAAEVGLYTDLVDRAEAFVSDIVPIYGELNYFYKNTAGFKLRLRGGSSFWFSTGQRDERTEIFLLYSGQAGYESPKASFMAGISGRWWLNAEGEASFGERTFHQLGIYGDIALGNVRPGLTFRLPLDEDMSDILDFVIGLNLNINLK